MTVPPIVSGAALTLVLAAATSFVDQMTPGGMSVPIVLAFLAAAAFRAPHRQLVRLSLCGALAAELTSGLPLGVAFVGTLLLPHALLVVLRRPRPDMPWFVRAGLVSASVVIMLGALQVFTGNPSSPVPPRLVGAFLLSRLVVPSLFSGLLALGMHWLLNRRLVQH